jgi:hypothetical protein
VQGLLDLMELLPEVMFSYLGGPAAVLQGPPICKRWQQLALQECSSIEVRITDAVQAGDAAALLGRKQDLLQLVSAGIAMPLWVVTERGHSSSSSSGSSRAAPVRSAVPPSASAATALAALCSALIPLAPQLQRLSILAEEPASRALQTLLHACSGAQLAALQLSVPGLERLDLPANLQELQLSIIYDQRIPTVHQLTALSALSICSQALWLGTASAPGWRLPTQLDRLQLPCDLLQHLDSSMLHLQELVVDYPEGDSYGRSPQCPALTFLMGPQQLPRLVRLRLTGVHDCITAAALPGGLQELDVDWLVNMAAVTQLTALRVLRVGSCFTSREYADGGLQWPEPDALQLAAQHLTGLQELQLSGQWMLQKQLQLQHLAPLTQLTALYIAGQQQPRGWKHPFVNVCLDQTAGAAAEAAALPCSLVSLSITGRMSAAGVRSLSSLTSLQQLELSGVVSGPAPWAALTTLQQLTRLDVGGLQALQRQPL